MVNDSQCNTPPPRPFPVGGGRRLHVCLILLTAATVAQAEPPHVSYIFPAGGQQGTKVDFRIGGHYLHDACPLQMSGPGVAASPMIQRADETIWFEGPMVHFPTSSRKEDYPTDYLGWAEIGPDARLGGRNWRVQTSQGVSSQMQFVVGELPEVVEEEIDGEPVPVGVQIPLTINGRIFPRQDVDVWTFEAAAGREITCAVVAQQIGSPLDAEIEVRDSAGTLIAQSSGKLSSDPKLRFRAESSGRYEVRIHDVNLDGLQHFVYRLTITDAPWIDHVYPLGGRRGSVVKLHATGQRIEGSIAAEIPGDAPDRWRHHFKTADGTTNEVLLAVDDFPEQLEAEPNNAPQQAPPVGAPAIVNGRIDEPGDVDVWALEMAQGQKTELAIDAARLGSPLDSVLVVRDEEGTELARNDDGAAGISDARLMFTAKQAGRYFVEVSERFSSRGGSAFSYRLKFAAPPAATAPDFALTFLADVVTVDRGGEAKLQVNLVADKKFPAAIKLTVEGLPPHVSVAEAQIPAKRNKATLVFQAAAEAPLDISRVRVIGTAVVDDATITRGATFASPSGAPPADELTLAIAEPTPFTITAEYEFSFVPRGSVHYKRFTIDRGGYQGPLEVQLAERQTRHLQGVSGPTIVVPAGASEFRYPVYLPPWMTLGRTSRTVLMATAEVEGADGKKHKVCYSSAAQNDQIIIRVSPALIRLNVPAAVALRPNSTVAMPVDVLCDPQVESPVEVQLLIPPHIGDLSAPPVTVEPGRSQAVLNVVCGPKPGPLNMPLTVRAVSGAGAERKVGETKVEFVVP